MCIVAYLYAPTPGAGGNPGTVFVNTYHFLCFLSRYYELSWFMYSDLGWSAGRSTHDRPLYEGIVRPDRLDPPRV
jgi:hypothetical protein